jgi:hypothetical protein
VLRVGEEVLCLPVSAAALLGRARALQEQGAPAEDVIEALDLALAESKGAGPLHAEILSLRVESFLQVGRHREALDAAEAYLMLGAGPRTHEIRRIAARLALSERGCDAAVPHLVAITSPTEAERAELARCGP